MWAVGPYKRSGKSAAFLHSPHHAWIARRVGVRQEAGGLHVFHELFHFAELHISRKRTDSVQPRAAAFIQQQTLCARKGRVAENFEFFARQVGVQAG